MTNETYHARPELSASNIKMLLKNPYEFINPVRRESKAFALGSAVHKMILEPHEFDDEFFVSDLRVKTELTLLPSGAKIGLYPKEVLTPSGAVSTSKAAKEIISTLLKDADALATPKELAVFNLFRKNKDKTLLSSSDYELCKQMTDAVMSHAECKLFLSDGTAESSHFSEIDGVDVKCRPDYYREDLGIIIDVKTCQDASPDSFLKDAANFGYYVQAAFYMDVLRSLGKPAHKFMFMAVEKKEPFMVGLYELDYTALEHGKTEYLRAFEIYKNIDKYKTPIYRDTADESVVQTLTLPNYVYYKRNAS